MRVPLSWLREYVEINLPIPELAERLTLAGLEVGAIEYIGLPEAELAWDPATIVVAEVTAVKSHPNADRLVLVVVDYGGDEFETAVTGAPNLRPYLGQTGLHLKVPFAMEGARLYDGHAQETKIATLKQTKIRGIPSRAMVCSAKELGLGEDHSGILMLPDDAPAPGTPLADYLGDVVLDLDITPNLARCMSVVGVAREVAALTGARLHLPDTSMVATGAPVNEQVQIEIEDPEFCNRYSATLIRDIAVGASPFWMRRRLAMAGQRPISNMVDVTNYVMLELGQPLHAFDYDLLLARAKETGHDVPTIIMRRAREGERMQTLDGVHRALTPDMLMITDTGGPIAVGGIMGGAETEINDQTTNILLESANFYFINNRRTAQALKLPSEATARFGRGVPASGTVAAAQRASELMRVLGGGEVAAGVADNYPIKQPVVTVDLQVDEVERVLGIAIPKTEVVRILESLDFTVSDQGNTLKATAPQHRLDIEIPADLLEEIARVYGYDRIPTTLLSDELPPQRANVELEIEEKLRDLLVAAGLQETITYSMSSLESAAKLTPGEADPDPADYIQLANPLTPERSVMRRTLMASLLETMHDNLRFVDRVAHFEIGRVYWPRVGEQLPEEPRHLCITMTGPRRPSSWLEPEVGGMDFFDLKGVVDALCVGMGLGQTSFAPVEHPTLQPGRAATLSVEGVAAGVLGEVHPDVCEAFDLGERRVCLAEFNLEKMLATAGKPVQIRPISTYPAVYEDLALVVDKDVPAAQVQALIEQAGGPMLVKVELFDLYRGEQIGADKKSLAYALTYQAEDRTLDAKAAAKIRNKIVRALERQLGATLRA
jgi:phenylalanyl-tRNA synthetase beta chain